MEAVYVSVLQGMVFCVARSYQQIVQYLIKEEIITDNSLVRPDSRSEREVTIKSLYGENWKNSLELIGYLNFNELFGREDISESLLINFTALI